MSTRHKHIIMQVYEACHRKGWQARVYAGEALGLLAQHVAHYSPAQLAQGQPAADAADVADTTARRTAAVFASFDATTVVAQAGALLTCGTVVRSPLPRCMVIHLLLPVPCKARRRISMFLHAFAASGAQWCCLYCVAIAGIGSESKIALAAAAGVRPTLRAGAARHPSCRQRRRRVEGSAARLRCTALRTAFLARRQRP